MTYCIDFFRKFKKEGNFCGLDKSQVSRLTAYLEIVEALVKQKIPEEQIYENFTVQAARPLIAAKGEAHTEGLNHVTAALKKGEKIKTGDLESWINPTISGGSATVKPKKKAPYNGTPQRPPLPVEKPAVKESLTVPPSAPIAEKLKEKYGGQEQPAPGQPIKPEHGIILTEAYCRAKKCENLKPCKERGNRIECFPAGAEPRHMNECPLAKRERLAQEGGFTPAGDIDPTNAAKFVRMGPVKITKAPMTISFQPSQKQQEFIERMVKSGEFETPEEIVSAALDTAMLQEGGA